MRQPIRKGSAFLKNLEQGFGRRCRDPSEGKPLGKEISRICTKAGQGAFTNFPAANPSRPPQVLLKVTLQGSCTWFSSRQTKVSLLIRQYQIPPLLLMCQYFFNFFLRQSETTTETGTMTKTSTNTGAATNAGASGKASGGGSAGGGAKAGAGGKL